MELCLTCYVYFCKLYSCNFVILVKSSLETLQEEVVKSIEPKKFIQHKRHIPTPYRDSVCISIINPNEFQK